MTGEAFGVPFPVTKHETRPEGLDEFLAQTFPRIENPRTSYPSGFETRLIQNMEDDTIRVVVEETRNLMAEVARNTDRIVENFTDETLARWLVHRGWSVTPPRPYDPTDVH